MGTLSDQVRRLTGVSVGEIGTDDVQAALDEHRCWHDLAFVELVPNIANVWKRGTINAWGAFEPGDQDAPHLALTDTLGNPVTGDWELSADGDVLFAEDQILAGTLYLSAYSYDVKAAAVDVLDQMIGTYLRDYDVKLGDQSLSRSQAVAQMQQRREQLASERLAVSVQRYAGGGHPMSRGEARLYRRAVREG